MNEYGDSFLLALFQEFYAEVIRLKGLVGEAYGSPFTVTSQSAKTDGDEGQPKGTWVYFPDVVAEDASTDDVASLTAQAWANTGDDASALIKADDRSAKAVDFPGQFQPSESYRISTLVWHALASLLQRQYEMARRYGGAYRAESYRKAQFVMVALADEIFLREDWKDKGIWVENLLESKIFDTHTAGEVFFENIDFILQGQDPDRDLAAVYLMALSLGFKGKYYDRDRGQLATYRRRLFVHICGREPNLDDETRRLFPEAYYYNVREESQRKLSDPRKWLLVLGLVVIVYTAATHAFWVEFTLDLNKVNQNISQVVARLKAPTLTSTR
ncbi:MAG TPA: DotU family type IV/VI secretion system protein [Pyrinomonadaceae bacterium]|jgi:type VI secretion system protein ImpK